MSSAMTTLAWSCVVLASAWLFFTYAGYPLVLTILKAVSPRARHESGNPAPPISLIIAVHNGGSELQKKLDATLALDYSGLREIIVSSDGSTDETPEIAQSFAARGVTFIQSDERHGKEAAQARAIAHASGEILVFTDVATELAHDALVEIVRPFSDPNVGSVSSEDHVDSAEGEGAYVRFEMALRRLENEATTLVGLSGSFFAVRRELAEPWPEHLASDFRTALETARRGQRAVAQPTARAYYRTVSDSSAEWKRKVRTVRRGLAVLSAYRDLLHPRFGRAALSVWGHKVCRFTSPFALVVLLAASGVGAALKDTLLIPIFALQVGAYAAGTAALLSRSIARIPIARLAGFFLLVNASILAAWGYHLAGKRSITWTPTQR